MDANLLQMLGYAFVGGIILNVMPCVLPVLTFKVMHVVESAHAEPRETRMHGLAYTAGIIATMLVLAGFVLALKASSEFVGWGMQFQNPAFVATLTALIFVFGLNAVGVFELPLWMSGGGDHSGYSGSFINGVLASVMATPCSAPFLGAAIAFALDKSVSSAATLAVFTLIGLGLAFPFLVVAFVPAAARLLPKPGEWMNHVKVLMGFTLFAAAAWLFGALRNQVTGDSAQGFLYFLLLLAVALWSLQRFAHAGRGRIGALVAGGLTAAGFMLFELTPPEPVAPEPVLVATTQTAPEAATRAAPKLPPVVKDGKIVWAPFSAKSVEQSLAMQRPVFMDYTADWCLNCKTNEKVFIEVERIRKTLTATNILPMKADMTNKVPVVEKWLADLGRNGIPVYVIYLPDGNYDLLPEVITTDMLETRLKAASEKYPPAAFKAPSAG